MLLPNPRRRRHAFGLLALLTVAVSPVGSRRSLAAPAPVPVSENPVEVGLVDWGRDVDAALARGKSTGRPVLILFQEVPGCAGCQKFGREVLSHPLIVEAIESEFVPVVVFNNRSTGRDKKMLDRFGERAWNYQVLRFVDDQGRDIVPRKEGVWSLGEVAGRLATVLQKQGRDVPSYLQTLVAMGDQSNQDLVAFAMHCFWTGESRLGGIDGVIATEAGWIDGREVTLVRYDTQQITLAELARKAAQFRCADRIYTRNGRAVAGLRGGRLDASYRAAARNDQKRQLRRLPGLNSVTGINAMQWTKLNSSVSGGLPTAMAWLSPRQRQQLDVSQAKTAQTR